MKWTARTIAKAGLAFQDIRMSYQDSRRIVRIDREELASLPPSWTDLERGQYLRILLGVKGIDCNRLYWVEYHPQHHCWLVSQQETEEPAPEPVYFGHSADALCLQALAEFRRTARAAWAALAARSPELARHGGKYALPERPNEVTPADLMDLLGGPGDSDDPVQFDNEGGWRNPSSSN